MAFQINGKASVKIKTNTKMWDRMVRNLSKANMSTARVGWWAQRNSEGNSLAQIASWNEEGHMNGGVFSGTITPPRPFIRVNFMSKLKSRTWVVKYFDDIHRIAIGKYTWKNLHLQIASDAQEKLKQSILEFKNPGNSPVTIAIKGFNDPLIDSGQMYDGVKFRVVKRVRGIGK